jgi:cupin fold WbuC family metalloprotein
VDKINEEIYYSRSFFTTCNANVVKDLVLLAGQNTRKRVRLCAHPDSDDKLHEMLIIHEKDCYVRPHKHPGKSESVHIIQGKVDIILFDESGKLTEVIKMGEYSSGLNFFFRMDKPVFHTLIIRSDILVFHETTNGPFNRKETVFAPWSPENNDIAAIKNYLSDIENILQA